MNVVVSEDDEQEGEDGRAEVKDSVEDGRFSKELFGGAVKSRWVMASSLRRSGRSVGKSVRRSVLLGRRFSVVVSVGWLVGGYMICWLNCRLVVG